MESLADGIGVSVPAAIVIIGVVAVQFILQIYSLIDLYRREVVLFEQKWIWLLIILFGNILGAVVYLALGRRAELPPVAPPPNAEASEETAPRAEKTADILYGRKDEQ